MADFDDTQKPNGGFVELDRADDYTLYLVLRRLTASIFSPDPDSRVPLLRRVKISVAENVSLLPEASRNSARNLVLWTRRGSPLRALVVISVSAVLDFLLFLLIRVVFLASGSYFFLLFSFFKIWFLFLASINYECRSRSVLACMIFVLTGNHLNPVPKNLVL